MRLQEGINVWKIKGQLDATDWFLLQNLLSAQHVTGKIMPIIRSSKVIQMVAACGAWRFCLPVGGLVWSCRFLCPGCGLLFQQVYVSGLRVVVPTGLCVRVAGCSNRFMCPGCGLLFQQVYVSGLRVVVPTGLCVRVASCCSNRFMCPGCGLLFQQVYVSGLRVVVRTTRNPDA
jgi:uncharacterized protein (UPF0212 family)